MRFKDEKIMWYAETTEMAGRLAHKSEREIQEILDDYNVITLRSIERPKVNILGRLLYPLIMLILCFVFGVKWLITGDGYIDTLVKRVPYLGKIVDYCGIR